MLGGYLQLTADVMGNQLSEKALVIILDKIIEAYARTNKHLFYAGYGAQLAEHCKILTVVNLQGGTGLGSQALFILAKACSKLFLARWSPEIGGGAAYIVDVALEIGHFGEQLCLTKNRLFAAAGYRAALMIGDGAKIAGTEAAAVMGDGEFYLLEPGDTAQFVI